MADVSCSQDIDTRKIFKKTLAELKVPVLSQARSPEDRLQRIARGQEVLARGQNASATDVEAIKKVRQYLNESVTDCAPLDVDKGVVDSEMEQRIALFQKRHVASDARFAGEKEIDGVVGRNTYTRLVELGSSSKANVEQATSQDRHSTAEAEQRTRVEHEIAERKRRQLLGDGHVD